MAESTSSSRSDRECRDALAQEAPITALEESSAVGRFEIVEHTADVGLRAYAPTAEETFAQATQALATILGAWDESRRDQAASDSVALEVEAPDLPALLADWLEEVLYVHETRDAVLTDVQVESVEDGRVRGTVSLAPRGERRLEGTHVKAITYHQLKMERHGDEWTAQAFVDV